MAAKTRVIIVVASGDPNMVMNSKTRVREGVLMFKKKLATMESMV